ncbi:MAG: undecaprenyl/decaprenyl-phosphate alpha-N-acetylglucosaminyl 1-phosphate transferase [Atopobiaceae bacterium]|nr:undecaprenyl/decaprenyl-phosphate alpha-N-acetylglucosaminyl 1-phosphate transferase [Atopobiaceae bacterium]
MEQQWIAYLCIFLLSLVVSLLMTPVASAIAWKLDAVDYPDKRRINRQPIPRMGGIAVFAGIVSMVILQLLGSQFLGWPLVFTPSPHLGKVNYPLLAVAFVVIFVTGLIDDRISLSPKQKLLGQLLAASIAVASGLVIGDVVNPLESTSLFHIGWLTYPVTIVYLVAYVNIFNLIDGLDGLASGIAFIASVTLFELSILRGQSDAASLTMALAGSTLGFLRYNFHPATIFLGDSGSLLLGFSLATASLLSVTRISSLTTILVPLVVAGIPIIDTLSAIIRRSRAHVSVGQADRGHIHHRLLDEGFDQRQTVLVIYVWTILLSVGAVVLTQVSATARILILLVLVVASGMFAAKLRLFSPVLLHHYNPRTGDDELISPQDPAFEKEEARFEQEHSPHVPFLK